MIAFRMFFIAIRLAWPYLFTPWRSPLLRWRMETYGISDGSGRLLHAEEISAKRFYGFCITHRKELFGFLRWAATQ